MACTCNTCDVILLYYLLQYIKQYLCACTIFSQRKLLEIYMYGYENKMRYFTMTNNNNDGAIHNEFNKNRYEALTSSKLVMISTHILSYDYERLVLNKY